MVQTGNNCGCSATQTTNSNNYINVNGKQVTRQFKDSSGKMLYAHIDSRGTDGVIYKLYKPGQQPQVKQYSQPRQSRADSYSNDSTPRNQYKSPVKDNFANLSQKTYQLVPTGNRDMHGRTIYRRQVVNNTQTSQLTNNVYSAPGNITQSSSIASNHDSSGFKNFMSLNLNHQTPQAIKTEKGAASFAVRNLSNKNIVIQRKENRHGDYDYRAAYWGKDPANPGKQKVHTYDLGAHFQYDNKKNHSTYNFDSDRHGRIKLQSREDKKLAYPNARESIKDLQPRSDIKPGPGGQVTYLSPEGQGNSSSTVTVDGHRYEISNESKTGYGYLVYKKQADGTRKIFLKSDSDPKKEEELTPGYTYHHNLKIKDLGEIPKSKEEIQIEADKVTGPFKDGLSAKELIEKTEVISPILDAQEVQDLKRAKNALRQKAKEDLSLSNDQIAKIDKLLTETQIGADLPVAKKLEIIETLSKQIDLIKTEDITERHKKHLEQEGIDDLFSAPASQEAQSETDELKKHIEGIVTELNPDANLFDSLFEDPGTQKTISPDKALFPQR